MVFFPLVFTAVYYSIVWLYHNLLPSSPPMVVSYIFFILYIMEIPNIVILLNWVLCIGFFWGYYTFYFYILASNCYQYNEMQIGYVNLVFNELAKITYWFLSIFIDYVGFSTYIIIFFWRMKIFSYFPIFKSLYSCPFGKARMYYIMINNLGGSRNFFDLFLITVGVVQYFTINYEVCGFFPKYS